VTIIADRAGNLRFPDETTTKYPHDGSVNEAEVEAS